MTPAKKKKKTVKRKPKPPPKEEPVQPRMVVPLLPSPPATSATGTTSQRPKFRIWYLMQGTTIGGLFLIGLGTLGFIFYLRTDKDHPPETALLWVSVIFIAAGFHFVSRQSVRNFINDFGKVVPFVKKNGDTAEQKAATGDSQ